MMFRDTIFDVLEQNEMTPPFMRLAVVGTDGSAPREIGAAMLVGQHNSVGTIGGGRLEFEAMAHAQALLGKADAVTWFRNLRLWPLGPALGQCCGGTVRLLFERYREEEIKALAALRSDIGEQGLAIHPTASGEPIVVCANRSAARNLPLPAAGIVGDMLSGALRSEPTLVHRQSGDHSYFIEPLTTPATPLFIYGAGHVGQAIVKIVSDLDFDVHWVDTHQERFPVQETGSTQKIIAREPAIIANAAPAGAFHIVLTYSHAIDLAICHALLAQPTLGFLGLIGSQTKRARFLKRLSEGGVTTAALSRLTCPIGIGALKGKEPATIAVSVAAQLIEQLEQKEQSNQTTSRGKHGTIRSMRA